MDMEEQRLCIACGAELAGPFQPEITLSSVLPAEEAEEMLKVSAYAWICRGCGLVHWYAGNEYLDLLLVAASADEAPTPKPDSSYERRTQMLHMLRRVRRM
jgi:uncharacterized protein with PIN domain